MKARRREIGNIDVLLHEDEEYSPYPLVVGGESLWLQIEDIEQWLSGVFYVHTIAHGGLMITEEVAALHLSERAQHFASRWKGWLCFEEDAEIQLVVYEHPEWFVPARKVESEQCDAERMIRSTYPGYFEEHVASGEATKERRTR